MNNIVHCVLPNQLNQLTHLVTARIPSPLLYCSVPQGLRNRLGQPNSGAFFRGASMPSWDHRSRDLRRGGVGTWLWRLRSKVSTVLVSTSAIPLLGPYLPTHVSPDRVFLEVRISVFVCVGFLLYVSAFVKATRYVGIINTCMHGRSQQPCTHQEYVEHVKHVKWRGVRHRELVRQLNGREVPEC